MKIITIDAHNISMPTNTDDDQFNNYYNTVAENKDIVRCTMSLQGLIMMLKNDIVAMGEVSLFITFSSG